MGFPFLFLQEQKEKFLEEKVLPVMLFIAEKARVNTKTEDYGRFKITACECCHPSELHPSMHARLGLEEGKQYYKLTTVRECAKGSEKKPGSFIQRTFLVEKGSGVMSDRELDRLLALTPKNNTQMSIICNHEYVFSCVGQYLVPWFNVYPVVKAVTSKATRADVMRRQNAALHNSKTKIKAGFLPFFFQPIYRP